MKESTLLANTLASDTATLRQQMTNHLVAVCTFTSLNLQLAERTDAAEIKEAIIFAWRDAAETRFRQELAQHLDAARTQHFVKALVGNPEDLEAKHRAALNEIERLARLAIAPTNDGASV